MENRFKKQGVGDFISSSFKLAHGAQLGGNYAFIFCVLGFFVLAAYLVIGSPEKIMRLAQRPEESLGLFLAVELVMGLVLTAIGAIVIHSQSEHYQGKNTSFGESVTTGFRKAFTVILSVICMMLLMGGIALAFVLVAYILAQILPALAMVAAIAFYVFVIYLAFGLIAAIPSILTEDLGPISSIQRSFALTKGKKLMIFGRLFVLGLVFGIMGLVFGLVAPPIMQSLPPTSGTFLIIVPIVLILYIYFILVQSASVVVLYFDLRAIKESFGLEQLAENFD